MSSLIIIYVELVKCCTLTLAVSIAPKFISMTYNASEKEKWEIIHVSIIAKIAVEQTTFVKKNLFYCIISCPYENPLLNEMQKVLKGNSMRSKETERKKNLPFVQFALLKMER